MHRRGDRGFALAVAIFALVVIAALIVGIFFAARQEMKLGMNSRTSVRALGAAEAGLNTTMANWQTGAWNALTVGDSVALSGTLASGGGSYTGWVRRLNTQLFLIRSTGTDPQNLAQRMLAGFVRLQLIEMNFNAAVTVRGTTSVRGSSGIDGRDSRPDGWTECPTTGLDTIPGLVIPLASDLDIKGSANDIEGGVATDPTINDSTFFKYGELDWNELVAMATKVYPAGDVALSQIGPVGTATTCNTGIQSNWGDPLRSAGTRGCWNYFPIIYVNGNLRLSGQVSGQGILLVTGDLFSTGQAAFYGPVIIRGSIHKVTGSMEFHGGVMAANVDLESNDLTGNEDISYSSCALATALRASSPGRWVRERSWVEVF